MKNKIKSVISYINNIEENEWLNKKSFLLSVFMVLSFIWIPQLIGAALHYNHNVDETIAVIIGNISVALIFIMVFFPTLKTHAKRYFSNFKKNFKDSLKYWGIGLLIMMISNMIINFSIMGGQIATNEELNRQMLGNYKLIGMFEAVLIAPFLEEMIFRFGIRKSFGKNKYFPLVSGLVFGFVHTLAGVFDGDLLNLLYVIPYGALGYVFGYLYNKTDSIFSSMTVHMLHNLMCYMAVISIM